MEQPELFNSKIPRPFKPPREFKVIALRECPAPERQQLCDSPLEVARYWRRCIATADWYSPERECFVILMLNARMRILGHHMVAIGGLDSVSVTPREVFRAAIIAASHSIILGHNHPSGDPAPSYADIQITRDLVRASSLLKLPINDHVIIGFPHHSSLRELGHF